MSRSLSSVCKALGFGAESSGCVPTGGDRRFGADGHVWLFSEARHAANHIACDFARRTFFPPVGSEGDPRQLSRTVDANIPSARLFGRYYLPADEVPEMGKQPLTLGPAQSKAGGAEFRPLEECAVDPIPVSKQLTTARPALHPEHPSEPLPSGIACQDLRVLPECRQCSARERPRGVLGGVSGNGTERAVDQLMTMNAPSLGLRESEKRQFDVREPKRLYNFNDNDLFVR